MTHRILKMFTLLLLALAVTAAGAAPAEEGAPDAPVMHLSFDYFDSLKDSAGNITPEAFGDIRVYYGVVPGGGCVYLDGDGDYLSLGQGFNFPGDFSVSLRVKPECAGRGEAALFAKYETNWYGPYDFYLDDDRPAVWISDGNGSYEKYVSETVLPEDEWSALTFTYDRASSVVTVYINGAADMSCPVPDIPFNTDTVTVGRQALMFEPYSNLQYKGYMDEIMVFEKCLTADEARTLNMGE